MSKQAVMHFVNGPLDGTRTKVEGEPPNTFKTIGTMFLSAKDLTQLESEIVPTTWLNAVHRYRLIYAQDIDFIYIHEGQESR